MLLEWSLLIEIGSYHNPFSNNIINFVVFATAFTGFESV